MSYTKGPAWQRYATADELINIRHFYSVDGVPVPITQLDGTAYGYYKTRSDMENQKNYQTFYNDMFGQTNQHGKKEYRVLKPEYVRLQQIISDRFNVISYIPEDRRNQNKYPSQNTKISTRPVGAVKAPRPDVFDPGLEAYLDQLLEEAGGKIEQVPPPTTPKDVDTSGDAYPTTFFSVIPKTILPEAEAFTIPTEDKTITANMITQHLDHFTIQNGRAKGQITFTLNDNFNSFYYGKDLVNIIQFKTKAGANILPFVKQNRLRFTETEKDETITYDESMNENTIVDLESFVWLGTTRPTAFSSVLRSEIKEGQEPVTAKDGFMAMGITGAIALLIGIGLILPERGGKK